MLGRTRLPSCCTYTGPSSLCNPGWRSPKGVCQYCTRPVSHHQTRWICYHVEVINRRKLSWKHFTDRPCFHHHTVKSPLLCTELPPGKSVPRQRSLCSDWPSWTEMLWILTSRLTFWTCQKYEDGEFTEYTAMLWQPNSQKCVKIKTFSKTYNIIT